LKNCDKEGAQTASTIASNAMTRINSIRVKALRLIWSASL
jgi:hypothetical protein